MKIEQSKTHYCPIHSIMVYINNGQQENIIVERGEVIESKTPAGVKKRTITHILAVQGSIYPSWELFDENGLSMFVIGAGANAFNVFMGDPVEIPVESTEESE
jgi:hypothetical protein|tara:strand:+ start:8868 stop:9176 length:309 start_codon:yes stop_codon:yes gene_type:complete